MNPENRVWIASILSATILVVYAQYLGRSGRSVSLTATQPPSKSEQPTEFIPSHEEELMTIESGTLRLEIGTQSASIREVVLKQFKNLDEKTPLVFGGETPTLSIGFVGHKNAMDLVEKNDRFAVWRGHDEHDLQTELSITVHDVMPKFVIELKVRNSSSEVQHPTIQVFSTWGKADDVVGRYNIPEAIFLTERTSTWQRTHLRYVMTTQPRDVPRGTLIATLSERFFCQSIKLDPNRSSRATMVPSKPGTIAAAIQSSIQVDPGKSASYKAEVYAGPRDFFILRDMGFEQAFPLGAMARLGLALMLILKWIAGVVHNYGVAIIIFSVLVTLPLFPFTIISFRSMKKMQELQPKLEQLKKKHKEDPNRLNRETLELFRENRVSPLSGCLPMMLQLPIFFSLLSAITHVIELRGTSFLWIKDLSLPDRIAKLPAGFDLNILPIVMAAMMYVQSRMSQQTTSTTQQQFFSGPMMAVVFGIMFYQVPSSLVLYWMTNSLISISCFKLIKI